MSVHTATIEWKRTSDEFLKGKYSREHTWKFDGGAIVSASSSPHVVPLPYSNAASVDPEEAFIASVASCHMLWFLHLARAQGFQIDHYHDAAEGVMSKTESGEFWISAITLRPAISYSGDKRPTDDEEQRLHHQAHEKCFIANSIKTEVKIAGMKH